MTCETRRERFALHPTASNRFRLRRILHPDRKISRRERGDDTGTLFWSLGTRFSFSGDPQQFRYSTRRHPLGDVDVSVVCETRIVRVNEFSGYPFLSRTATHRIFVFSDLLSPLQILAQMDQVIVLVQYRDPRAQIGDKKRIFELIYVGRQNKAIQRLSMYSFKSEPLKAFVRPVRYDDQRFIAPGINPYLRRQMRTRSSHPCRNGES